ncbi:PREDICTED: neutral ceramidase [Nicrophorus vespilloides]|uniref:Neutral ceramidase n=1 Tax=Nicrophorus vespilloides TaxID=110193 RepID=A0ABM1N0Y6_NICVS|nr:PREDICTED: neutral ceramidase [Nicrophorus vespilloides]
MMAVRKSSALFSLLAIISALAGLANADYEIGVGIADCTGPTAEINFMGYAKGTQKGQGLHLRQFARAFIIQDSENRIVFVTADVGMIGIGVRREVLKRLSENYGDIYNEQNVIISGTHTHGGPGGFLMDVIFDITCLGFSRETFNAYVDGIVNSIKAAHEHIVPGKIFIGSTQILDASINRSPSAYLLNPQSERDEYEHDVDKELVQLKFVSSVDNSPIGVINWFPVHATSMNNTNHLVSSDNVGYASILFEKKLNKGALPGKGKFVAGFASSNLGDVSPNIKGAKCINTGEPCDRDSSTCGGEAKYCIASGPGEDIFDSTKIIANRILSKATALFDTNDSTEVTGPIRSIHQYVDMPKQEIEYQMHNGTVQKVRGCKPAMGYSFAAGTTDGPGEFDFKQGTTTTNEFWNFVRDFLAPPTDEDISCQSPKPILLATGRMIKPYQWQPEIIPTQVAMIGDVVIAALPGEFTTMSGRRMKKVIKETVLENGGSEDTKVILAGLCNVYTDYITTPEEYQMQRYEAASTIYGPYTLPIHLNQYKLLTEALLNDQDLGSGPNPPDFSKKLISFIPPVILDLPDYSRAFGECLEEPNEEINVGETVSVKFVSGHPRNNLMHDKTYLTVERQEGEGWNVVATDGCWETKFSWNRTYFASSEVTIDWEVTDEVKAGTYRIQHFGHSKSLFGGIKPYRGTTRPFKVVH